MKTLGITIGFLVALAGGPNVRGQTFCPGLKAIGDASTDIIIAEVLATNPRKALEGARDTVQLKVVRTLKGPLQPGEKIGVYYHLLWIDTEKWVLEQPKFQEGKRCTVFITNSGGYTLTDPWLAVLPEHPGLDKDVAYSLNCVGDLWSDRWSDRWRGKHNGAIVSCLRIDLLPEVKVVRTKEGLILPARIVNHSSKEIATRLGHECHSGEWPATNLFASVSDANAKQPSAFVPVYLKGEQGETKETHIGPGKAVTVELRMDWPRTDSAKRVPLMSLAQAEYQVRLLLLIENGPDAAPEYATSASNYVHLVYD